MKIVEFRFDFHWNLFPGVLLTINQHWFRQWLGAIQATSHYLNHCWPSHRRIYAMQGGAWQYVWLCSDNGLAPNRWQAIIWSQCWYSSLTHTCVTWPQLVNTSTPVMLNFSERTWRYACVFQHSPTSKHYRLLQNNFWEGHEMTWQCNGSRASARMVLTWFCPILWFQYHNCWIIELLHNWLGAG